MTAVAGSAVPARTQAPRLRPGRWLGLAILAALIVLLILFRWDWLRGPLARYLSNQLHRPVTIEGHLHVRPWSWTPQATVSGLVIGSSEAHQPLARLPQVTIQLRIAPLVLHGRLVLPLAAFDRPQLSLFRDGAGRTNWTTPARGGARPLALPQVDRLVVRRGQVRYVDQRSHAWFVATASTNGAPTASGRGLLTLSGQGAIDGAGPTPVARLPDVTVQASLQPLLERREVVLPLVAADRPDLNLARDASGRGNWQAAKTRVGPPKPLKLPPIGELVVRDGHIRYVDAHRRIRFVGTASTREQDVGSGRGTFELTGSGDLNGSAFAAFLRGAPLVGVDVHRPWPFVARLAAGPTQLSADGRIDRPFDFSSVSGAFRLEGPDLADIYKLTGIALPNSPPYALSAGFARRGQVWALRRLQGRVGQSDLEGAITVDDHTGRPMLVADLASRRVRIADLVAVVGGTPAHAPASELSPLQKAVSARLKAQHRILPDARLDVDRLKGMDARATYRAASVDAGRTPIRALALTVRLDHSLLAIAPLSADLAQGRLTGTLRIDARGAVPRSAIDLTLSDARLGQIAHASGPDPVIDGKVVARVRLAGAGASVREAAAHADGQVSAIVSDGQVRKTLAAALGIDLDRTAFLLISRNKSDTPLTCAVANFTARDGRLTAGPLEVDTDVVRAKGSGDIDLREETLDLRLQGKPKKVSLLRLDAPITLTGRLASPKLGVDVVKAVPQAAGAVALGFLAAPLAAILPFLEPGLHHGPDCSALEAQADAGAPPKS